MWDTAAMGMGKGGGDSCDSCRKKGGKPEGGCFNPCLNLKSLSAAKQDNTHYVVVGNTLLRH